MLMVCGLLLSPCRPDVHLPPFTRSSPPSPSPSRCPLLLMAVKSSANPQTTNPLANGLPPPPSGPPPPTPAQQDSQYNQGDPAQLAPGSAAASKKKKKKAAKRAAQQGQQGGQPNLALGGQIGFDGAGQEGYDGSEDDLPALEHPVSLPANFPYPPGVVGGYPSAGAVMNGAMGAAFGGVMSGLDYSASGLSPSAHADLVNTATELYRRMEDPSFGETEEYWTSLPSHLRNFIRNALPMSTSGAFPPLPPNRPNGHHPQSNNQDNVLPLPNSNARLPNGQADGARPANNTMLAMAQQIVSAAHAGARGGTMTANAVLPPGSFDPSSLDFAFQPHPDHGMERQGGQRGGVNGGQGGGYVTGAAVGGVVMLDERSQEEYDRYVSLQQVSFRSSESYLDPTGPQGRCWRWVMSARRPLSHERAQQAQKLTSSAYHLCDQRGRARGGRLL